MIRYDVLDCNDMLKDTRYAGRNVTIEEAQTIAAARMPRPEGTRRFAHIDARPVNGGAPIVLRRGEA